MAITVEATREQVLAVRLRAHGLTERRPSNDLLAVAGACGVRNTPPGSAALGLAARLDGLTAASLDRMLLHERSLVEVLSVRASPLVVPVKDITVFTVGALATNEASVKVALLNHMKELQAAGITGLDAVRLASEATRAALAAGPLGRGELSAAVTAAVPPALTSRCEACMSTHIREMLFRTVGVAGGFVIVREGRETRYVRPDQWLGGHTPAATSPDALAPEVAQAELLRRYLRCFGPSTPEAFAEWAGIGAEQARETWETLAGSLTEAALGGKPAWMLAEDAAHLTAATLPRGVRLLPPYDGYLDQRDRATIVPDKAHQKRLWRAIGNPGAMLVDGEVVGSWRPQKKGKRLLLTVEPFGPLRDGAIPEIEHEAALLALMRGCTSAEVTVQT